REAQLSCFGPSTHIILNPTGSISPHLLPLSPAAVPSPSDCPLQGLLEPRASFSLCGEQEEGCGSHLCLAPGNLRHGPVLDKSHQDVSTLTDLCSGADLPEVEIVSLLTEELPRYTLRADYVFGYEHDDWLHTPLLPPEAALGLTYEQIDETLKYFLLCSERVGQVTKTYHDIEAVTHLLEEKERDLELAARIGQSLLKQNKALTERNELLDEQLEIAKEEIAQLRHELSMRDDLLHLYASSEEIEPAAESRSPVRRNESTSSLSNYIHYDFLQQKLKGLEEENLKLRTEVSLVTGQLVFSLSQPEVLGCACIVGMIRSSTEGLQSSTVFWKLKEVNTSSAVNYF
uniref:Huntingtin associated protein 1 n=1 Tax=Pygocentrus nattereri TaxID=42514 RepID=A0AAR2K2W0_PYGNA